MKYDVRRRHQVDKLYEEGDQREASEAEVAHLVKAGVLYPAAAKSAPSNRNKKAPSNPNKKD